MNHIKVTWVKTFNIELTAKEIQLIIECLHQAPTLTEEECEALAVQLQMILALKPDPE